MIKRLEGEGMVTIDRNQITLPPEVIGWPSAPCTVTAWLSGSSPILGMSWAEAHNEAGK